MFRLGRLPHDQAAVDHAPSLGAHRFAAALPPAKMDRSAIPYAPGLYQNDILPDCTAAGIANAAGMVAALNGYAMAIDPAKVPPFYASCVGCEPTGAAMAATDGAVLLDVLARQARSGFDTGPQSLVGLFGTLPPMRSVLASAVATLGHAYIGVGLRERDEESFSQQEPWFITPDDGAAIGGHCVVIWDYAGLGDGDLVRIATWGALQPATWAWVEARTEEAYALLWRQLAAADGPDIGVDVDVLEADLARWAM